MPKKVKKVASTVYRHLEFINYIPWYVPLTKNQSRKECLKAVGRHNESLKFVLKQDDEIILASLKFDYNSIVHVNIELKKETVIEIDLLYGKLIERDLVLKDKYQKLLRKCY